MNTLFLRLEGPLQSWGVTSRFVYRDTADVPSFSGVLGLVCAAMGLRRDVANARLADLATLQMGVRVDRPGLKMSDYHTAGAGIGMMSAAGVVKRTSTTGEIETHVMRKEYLADASFLVVLLGDAQLIAEISAALQDPVWPQFLGRKSCPPSIPVFDSVGEFADVTAALQSKPWRPRLGAVDAKPARLRAYIPASPSDGESVADVPTSFTHRVYQMRNVQEIEFEAEPGDALYSEVPRPDRRPATQLPGWNRKNTPAGQVPRREERLNRDHSLCVFCKEPAHDVHHVTYENAGHETPEDLRSVCRLCHDAMTLLEYAGGFGTARIDPFDPASRDTILAQRKAILRDRDPNRRHRELRKEDE